MESVDAAPRRFAAWSLEAPASEAEFLRREIGMDARVVDPNQLPELIGTGQRTVVVVSEPDRYRQIFEQAAPRSIIVFLLSDEGYSPERLELCSSSSVAAVYRHYGLEMASTADIAASAREFLRAAGLSTVSRRMLPHLLSEGRRTRQRMQQWKDLAIPVRAVPLGYTSEFCRAVLSRTDRDIGDDASLVGSAPIGEQAGLNDARDIDVVFRGSPGNPQRQAMVEEFMGLPGSDVGWVDAQWQQQESAERAGIYVETLLSARRALCPPGAINTETFRYYEALLCGAEPIEPRTALTHLGRPLARGSEPFEGFKLALAGVRASLMAEVEGDHG